MQRVQCISGSTVVGNAIVLSVKRPGLQLLDIRDDSDVVVTAWVFSRDCSQLSSSLNSVDVQSVANCSMTLNGLSSILKAGLYCSGIQRWRRNYVTRSSKVVISVLEDVPDCGGQQCIWMASLAMTSFLEGVFFRSIVYSDSSWMQNLQSLRSSSLSCRILELGAGCGLPSMLCKLVLPEAQVIATEQRSCISYLNSNLHLNADLFEVDYDDESDGGLTSADPSGRWTFVKESSIFSRQLSWGSQVDLHGAGKESCDLILGCDVSYDPKNLGILLQTIRYFLRRSPSSQALLMHDNDSCTCAKRIESILAEHCTE